VRKKVPVDESALPGKKIDFERERLLNLISSKVRTGDMEIAKKFADELLETEMRFALLRKAKQLKKYNNLLLKIILLMLAVLFAAMTFMVLNINPSFNLVVQAVSVLLIVSSLVVHIFLINRFTKTVYAMMDAYDAQKQPFIERLLDTLTRCKASEVRYQSLFPMK
jgi:uncharacterized membrane protein YqjE